MLGRFVDQNVDFTFSDEVFQLCSGSRDPRSYRPQLFNMKVPSKSILKEVLKVVFFLLMLDKKENV